MIIDNQNVFMNRVKENGGRDFLYLCLIMVFALMKHRGLGVVVLVGLGVMMVGMNLKQILLK
jgi:hypothetical protein